MTNPKPATTQEPRTKTPSAGDPRRRRTALGVLVLLAAATLAGQLLIRRIAAGGEGGGGGTLAAVSAASGPVALSARLDRSAVLQGGDGLVRVELALTTEERRAEQTVRVPTDLLVILDRSGSMGGEKIELARAAVVDLMDRLAPGDRFALVTYSDGAELAVPFAPATAANRQRWRAAVGGIGTGGGTAMSAGLDTALRLTSEVSTARAGRIVLISDGLANQGDPTLAGLTGRAAVAARRETPLTTVGVGLDFDEQVMNAIADAGTGNYYYLQEAAELASVFARELEATRETVASGVAVTVEPAAGVEVVDAGGYPLERRGTTATFRPGSLFAGQELRLWVSLRVPSGDVGEQHLGRFIARFRDGESDRAVVLDELPRIACVASEEHFLAGLDEDAWGEAVAGDEYHQLEAEVAGYVKGGLRQEALEAISAYEAKNAKLNEAVASPVVEQRLGELDDLAASVEDAFEGEEQEQKQKMLSKLRQLNARDGRRAGAKIAVPPPSKAPQGQ